MTYRSEGIRQMTPSNFVEVSPELAARQGLTSGSMVKLQSLYGDATVPVVVTDRVEGDQLYMPLNSITHPVNRLTGSNVDRATHTPAYKEISVSMTVLPEVGPDPLPRQNFRHGHPTPQMGVEVERKWKRQDYSMPGTNGAERLVQIQTRKV
jgi:formate dehydrogenase major subunit